MKIKIKSGYNVTTESLEEVWEFLISNEPGTEIEFDKIYFEIFPGILDSNSFSRRTDVLRASPKVCKKYYDDSGHCDEVEEETDVSFEGLERLYQLAKKTWWSGR